LSIVQQGGPAGRRGPSYGKTLYLYPKHGQLVAAAWPRKPRGPKTPKQLANMERFRQAQKMIPHIDPGQMLTAIEAVKGTLFLPRDLITAAMYGRTFAIAIPGARTLVPMAFKKDVSFSLDTVGLDQGDLLARGKDFWDPINPGIPGQVLVTAGPGQNPFWSTVGPGDIETMLTSGPQATKGILAEAMHGNQFWPSIQVFVDRLYATINFVSGGSYHAILFAGVNNDIGEILFRSGAFVPAATGKDSFAWTLPTPVTLLANTPYAACIYRSDLTPTTPLNEYFGSGQLAGWPSKSLRRRVHAPLNNPQVGDPITYNEDSNPRAVHLVYRI